MLFTAPVPGRLYFGINETYAANNSGAFSVTLPDALAPASVGPLQITEFLAENYTNIRDEDGDYSDWIEIYNPNPSIVSLAGYQLCSGTNTWFFPPYAMSARQFLVVFASGKTRTSLPGPFHTSFKLDAGGEYLALKNPGGAVISEFAPAYPPQTKDVSCGRTNAGSAVVFFPDPTPSLMNGTSVTGLVADTVFSVKRGFFAAPFELRISTATPGASIRYTLNGSTPSESNGVAYSGPLTISTTTTLRARAFKPGLKPTDTDTETYIFPASVVQQTEASALAYGWPTGPINGQVLRYGVNSLLLTQYTSTQMIAALQQIPSFSLVTDQTNLTDPALGIYVNASGTGEFWERPASMELIYPDGTDGFRITAGVRIRGGQSRSGSFPKHSFHLFFRREYGEGKLKFPLFGANGAREFDTLDLRCEHGYAYADPYPVGYEFTAMRDAFCRDLWGATGYASTRSRYYHLFLNGQYWGLYQTQERAQEDFGASYLGGKPEDYDGVAATGLPQLAIESSAGSLLTWVQLWSGARATQANPANSNYFALLGRNSEGSINPNLAVLLDPKHLAAYMLLHYYVGHGDEPLSVSFNFEKPNNYRAIRNRVRNTAWNFMVHDGESSMMASQWVNNRANSANLTSPNRADFKYSNPEWIHEDLLANAEYRITFADVAQWLLLNNGPFTASKAQAIWDGLAAQIDQAVIGESIRWGKTADHNQNTWAALVAEVRSQFFPARSATVIAQLRQRNLFPSVNAPAFSQHGGEIPAGYALTLAAGGQNGTIYYTRDGSDPRAIGGSISAGAQSYGGSIQINSPGTVRTRFRSTSGEWSALNEAYFSTFAPASAGNLIVSKLHYHPPPPNPTEVAAGFTDAGEFEYIELQNTSDHIVELHNVQINAGVTFLFATSSIPSLPPGARVCVAENVAAFGFRYGAGLPVAGQFTGNLSNGGETVQVVHSTGGVIALFTYDDADPWPTTPDGSGPALVLKASNLDPAYGTNWRPSYVVGGNPGQADQITINAWRVEQFSAADLADSSKEPTLWGDLADPDGDGAVNVLEFAFATAPTNAASKPLISASLSPPTGPSQHLRVQYQCREGASVSIHAEASTNLVNWAAASTFSQQIASQVNGTAIVTLQETVPTDSAANSRKFVRLHVGF